MNQTVFERYGAFATVRKVVSTFYEYMLDIAVEELAEERGRNFSEFVVQGGAQSVLVLDESRLLIIPYGDQGLVLLDLVVFDLHRSHSSPQSRGRVT